MVWKEERFIVFVILLNGFLGRNVYEFRYVYTNVYYINVYVYIMYIKVYYIS